MLEKLKLVEARYLEMAERAAQPDFYNDPKAASQLLKEQRQLEPDRKSTRLNSSHPLSSRMPSSA